MHAVALKHKFWLNLSAALLIVGAPLVFFPWSPVATNLYGWIPVGFLIIGFYSLTPEFSRVVFGPEVWRPSRFLIVGSSVAAFVGFLPVAVHAWSDLFFGFEYPGQALIFPIGATVAGAGIVVGSIGLLLEWRTLPKVVDDSAHKALTKMRESGFGIDDSRLWIGIDSGVAIDGWSYSTGDDYAILLSPSSVYSKESVGPFQTIIKEMSHAYLTQTRHASHINKTNEETLKRVTNNFPEKWQLKTLRDAEAFPWETYAEDLTFKVLEDSKTRWAKTTLEFFEQRDSTTRTIAISKRRGMWGNALLLLRVCYRASMMERYNMPDPEGTMKKAKERLLSKPSPEASPFFDYFHDVFIGLKDNVTAEGYQKMLEDYLSKFVALAELGNASPLQQTSVASSNANSTNHRVLIS